MKEKRKERKGTEWEREESGKEKEQRERGKRRNRERMRREVESASDLKKGFLRSSRLLDLLPVWSTWATILMS